ncbi:hypothetical protein M1O20_05415, partial [Dehalococcoidia bacterium]|nr:hypothetical protein [Dehalococcoidia bacterium]
CVPSRLFATNSGLCDTAVKGYHFGLEHSGRETLINPGHNTHFEGQNTTALGGFRGRIPLMILDANKALVGI